MMKNSHIAVAMMAVAMIVPVALAAPLMPGTSHVRPGFGLIGTPYTVGAPPIVGPLLASLTSPYVELVGFEGITGSVTSEVYASTGGGLVFLYKFTADAVATTPLVRASLSGAGWAVTAILDNGIDPLTVVAGQSTDGGGAIGWDDGAPYLHERAPVGAGSTIAIQYRVGSDGTVLAATDSSAVSWFDTDATTWAGGHVGLLDSGAVSGARVLVPAPVPGAVALGVLGLGMFYWMKRRTS